MMYAMSTKTIGILVKLTDGQHDKRAVARMLRWCIMKHRSDLLTTFNVRHEVEAGMALLSLSHIREASS